MTKPKVLVLSGYGLNCEEETAYAFELAGAKAEIVHINDLIGRQKNLKNYQILAIPGGFSYGDDTGSGKAFANRIRNNLLEEVESFIKKDRLVIGICNGFQIMVHLGLFSQPVALTYNQSARYIDKWVDLNITNQSPWLKGIKKITLPIAHGEGKFYASKKILKILDQKRLIALKYLKNPNGSLKNIAGITGKSGRLLGLMPHPERAIFFTQLPNWPLLKEGYKRADKNIPQYGPGLQIFKNGVNYFKKN